MKALLRMAENGWEWLGVAGSGWEIIGLGILPDHVQLFIRSNPTTLPSDIQGRSKGRSKGRSSQDSRQEFPHRRKLPSLWTRSFFLSTVGNVSRERSSSATSQGTPRKGTPRREPKMGELKTTVQVRLDPTPAQAALLRAHGQEDISTITTLVAALDSDVLPDGGKGTSTKDFTATLPSAVKNQALRDARSLWNRSLTRGASGAAQAHLPVAQSDLAHRGRDTRYPWRSRRVHCADCHSVRSRGA
jgi:hypothetical protein